METPENQSNDHPENHELDKFYIAIMKDVFNAEESKFLEEIIGKNATRINECNFGGLFGSLQGIFLDRSRLYISRIFENPNSRYLTWSIPSALTFMKNKSKYLKIPERPTLENKLVSLGVERNNISSLDENNLTLELIRFFKSEIDKPNISKVIGKLKTIRDKSIAHHEAIQVSELPRHTYDDMDQLLKLAKDFLSSIGNGYLSRAYECDGEAFPLTSDAARTSRAMKRLLKNCNIIE